MQGHHGVKVERDFPIPAVISTQKKNQTNNTNGMVFEFLRSAVVSTLDPVTIPL